MREIKRSRFSHFSFSSTAHADAGDAFAVKSSKLVGMARFFPVSSARLTSTAMPRLWLEPFFGSAT
ncbi:hypothetical protein D3C83_167800 [compost metagenome]